MKLYLQPTFRGDDRGEGGIRRIVEAQHLYLPEHGFEFVDTIDEADVIATHGGYTLPVPTGKPWIVHTHGLYWAEYRWPKWCHDLNAQVIDGIRKADYVTSPSDWVAYAIGRGMWMPTSVLWSGVDVEDWTQEENRGYVLWNKSRADPVCDPRPVNKLASILTDITFVTSFGEATPNVTVTGRVPYQNAKALLSHAGVYLCTTRETFGIGTLEAMASGIPVVGWRWGGQREFIEDGVNGMLVEPGDYDALALAVRWAVENRDQVGAAARQLVVDRFQWKHLMKDYADLYKGAYQAMEDRFTAPKVSVVIPSYNLGRYLPDAVRSVQAQTMEDWEIVIVDDASTDDSLDIASELYLTDSRIRVIRNEENLYLAGALNKGIEEAWGRYIVPLDADNMLAPDCLETLSRALDGDRGIDIAYGACRFVQEDGTTPDYSVGQDGISGWPRDFSFRHQVQERNQIPSTSMYRRKVWERSGGYRRRFRTAEDADYWTRASSLGFAPRRVTNKVTLIYRQRVDSMSRIEEKPHWASWYPWSRLHRLVPFGVAERPPHTLNGGLEWHVPSGEPARITVVIPVGPGHEGYLVDAIDSVEAQTYRSWNCIVVNDTGEMLTTKLPPWVKLLNTDGMKGPAHARNRGIAASTTELFVPLDADDYLQADALLAMLEIYDVQGGYVYPAWYDLKDGGEDVYVPLEWDALNLIKRGAIHAVTALYEKAHWAEVQGFDEQLSHWEDWDFQIKLAYNGVCGTLVPRALFSYRKETGLRRESMAASFEEGKAAILEKWSALWNGTEDLMAKCGGCPGGGGGVGVAPIRQQQLLEVREMGASDRTDLATLEYIGIQPSTRTFLGRPSGQKYRFGANPGHRIKLIFATDVPHFQGLTESGKPCFRLAEATTVGAPSSPVMEAQTVASPVVGVPDHNNGAPAVIMDDDEDLTVDRVTWTNYTSKELRQKAPTMTFSELRDAIAQEKAGPKRATVLTVLSRRLNESTGNS